MLARVSACFAALTFSFVIYAQPLADRIPADALIYVGWSGSESMGPGYANSHLKAVLDESKLGELLDQSIPKLLAKAGQNDRQAAQMMQLLSSVGGPMWRHPTALYFGGLDTLVPNAPPMPKVALLCDAGKEGAALAMQLKNLLAQSPAPVNVEEQGGFVALTIGVRDWGAAKKPAAALPTSKTFTSALTQVKGDAVVAAYVDLEGIVALADQMTNGTPAGANWAKMRDALGLGGIKRAIVTAGFDGKDWLSQAYVEAPLPRVGALPKLIDGTPLSADILKSIPATSNIAAAGKFDLGGLVSGVRKVVSQMDPRTGQMIDGGFDQLKQILQMDVQTDLLEQFGNEWALFIDPLTAGNGVLGFAVVNRPKTPVKLEGALSQLEDIANREMAKNLQREKMTIEFKRTQVGDLMVHHLAVPFVSPSWGVKDGNWYLGLYPQVVAAAADNVASKGKSILDNPDYLAIQKRLGSHEAVGISFVDLPKTAPDGYQELLMVGRLYLGFADMFGAQTPAMLLPPLKKIMPHLSAAGGVSWVDAAGFHSSSVSPFPGSELLSTGGGGQMMIGQQAMLVSILLPSLNRARETANRVKCASNMRQVGMAILLYSNENKGKYPPDLGTLIKTQDVTAEVFVCPSALGTVPDAVRHMKPDDAAAWVNENSNYVYLGAGMNNTATAETIVLYEKPDDHGQGMNMLFGDGHVEFLLMPGALEAIEAQKNKKKGI